ncbi:MAG: aa3-type cytochrome c oxidase subunit IV [Hyphomicrobiales bacterium]|nr:aa3-type cytochrome c oxidase subunit IV [Hyphomicrobiales bacterium]
MSDSIDLVHSDMDYADHEETYARFTRLVKYGAITIVTILVILAFITL